MELDITMSIAFNLPPSFELVEIADLRDISDFASSLIKLALEHNLKIEEYSITTHELPCLLASFLILEGGLVDVVMVEEMEVLALFAEFLESSNDFGNDLTYTSAIIEEKAI